MKPPTKKPLKPLILFAFGCHFGATAQDIITPVSATSPTDVGDIISGFAGQFTADELINGDGLSAAGDLLTQIHVTVTNNNAVGYWLAPTTNSQEVGPQQIVFELAEASNLGTAYIWQYTRTNESWNKRGLKDFDISFSTDGGTSYDNAIQVSLPLGQQGDPTDEAVQTFTFPTKSGVTHVKFHNLTNHGDGSWHALAEVRFGGAVAPSVRPQLVVESDGPNLTFTWNSQAGKVYDLLTSIDPENDGDPATWPEVADSQNIAATPGTNMHTITRPADPNRLYVVREENAPPPPPAFFDDFESVPNPDWTTGTNGGDAGTTVWERGTPTNVGPTSGYDGSATCFGTNISTDYTLGTDIWLRTPPIDLTGEGITGATLSFFQHRDTDLDGEVDDDYGTIRVLDANSLAQLGGDIATDVEGFDFDGENNPIWVEFEAIALPAEALGKEVVIEFRFKSDDLAATFAGWYIDNVMVEVE